jgi:P pilus assembly chaperone PapD
MIKEYSSLPPKEATLQSATSNTLLAMSVDTLIEIFFRHSQEHMPSSSARYNSCVCK